MKIGETIKAAAQRKKRIYSNELNEQAVRDLINRIAYKGFDEKFKFIKIESDGYDKFVLKEADGKIQICASDTNAACAAVNYYLKEFLDCNISPISRNVNITPETKLNFPEEEIKQESPFLYRYFLNYCTYSYTMAFWKWEDYEYLIDYMALSGINLALNIVGYEAAVKELLEKYGYTSEEIGEYICGSGYFAWQWMNRILAEKVLICTVKEGTRESVFIARPSVNVQKVSMWTATFCAYDEKDLIDALELLFSCYDVLKDNECYQFDISDLARQALSNYGWHVLEKILKGENAAENQQLFLRMIEMQDSLMSANPRTCFSTWLSNARSFGRNEKEKILFEKNARYLISFWSDEISAKELHDYASKEWGGLLKGYHYKRWEKFFDMLSKSEDTEGFDWYGYEKAIFADCRNDLDETPPADKKNLIEEIIRIIGE